MAIRSYLYAPGNRRDLIEKALTTGADALILDLEDAVPVGEKPHARCVVREFLADAVGDVIAFVRLNAGCAALEDVSALSGAGIAGVIVSKAEDADLVRRVDECLARLECAAGRSAGSIAILPLIESVTGLYALGELAAASPRVRRFAFGAGDFVRDIRGEPTSSRIETLCARIRLVMQSRLLRLEPPVAHVFTPIHDEQGLRRACAEDRSLGFYGRSCIHPSQVQIINAAFSQTEADIAHARAILAAYEESVRQGRGALILDDGTFVDEAVAARARLVLSAN